VYARREKKCAEVRAAVRRRAQCSVRARKHAALLQQQCRAHNVSASRREARYAVMRAIDIITRRHHAIFVTITLMLALSSPRRLMPRDVSRRYADVVAFRLLLRYV